MRIGYFVPRCTTENSHGRYVIEIAKRLAANHHVAVYAGRFWPPLRSLVECHRVPVPNRPTVLRIAGLWGVSMAVPKSRFDIIHIQGADARVGNVFTAHCCNAAMRAASVNAGRVRRWNYVIGAVAERHCFSNPAVQRIIAVSSQVKGDIERYYGVPSERIAVIPHGVDAEAFHPRNRAKDGQSVRQRLGISVDEFVLVFVGGDYRLKGLPVLLEAVRKASVGITVVAVGVAEHAIPEPVRTLERQAGRLLCVGEIADTAPYYAAADCFVLPTLYDTFSLSTLEAMATGLPVVVSRAAGVSEQLTHGLDSLLLDDPSDATCLAAHLGALVRDGVLRARLGQQARMLAERLSWEAVTERTAAVYRDVVLTHP